LISLSFSFAPTEAYAKPINLPEIGQSGGAYITPVEEYRTGEAVMRNIRRVGAMLDDALLNDYLNHLGYRIVAHSDATVKDFNFFIVNDPAINAFALPGGFIGINYGLLLAADSESELASVLAHEIAHVTQRHHARAYEFADNNNIPVLATLIAALILGSQGSELGSAALAALSASSIQSQINFTRANEKEADYIGIGLLADSGFNPAAMSDFFGKLSRESRLYGYSAPEFLRTHPVSESRMADAGNRARQYQKNKPFHSPINFYLMQARLRVLGSSDNQKLIQQLRAELKKNNYKHKAATQYALALALMEAGKYKQSKKVLGVLLESSPERIAFLLANARLESRANHHKKAIKAFKSANSIYPGNESLSIGYVDALLRAKKPQAAKTVLHKQLLKSTNNPISFKLLAETETRLGNKTGTHVAMAEYYYRVGLTHQALGQLEVALKSKNLDFYNTARIEARITNFKDEIIQLKALQE
jgi:predicted Zn-dependent protease